MTHARCTHARALPRTHTRTHTHHTRAHCYRTHTHDSQSPRLIARVRCLRVRRTRCRTYACPRAAALPPHTQRACVVVTQRAYAAPATRAHIAGSGRVLAAILTRRKGLPAYHALHRLRAHAAHFPLRPLPHTTHLTLIAQVSWIPVQCAMKKNLRLAAVPSAYSISHHTHTHTYPHHTHPHPTFDVPRHFRQREHGLKRCARLLFSFLAYTGAALYAFTHARFFFCAPLASISWFPTHTLFCLTREYMPVCDEEKASSDMTHTAHTPHHTPPLPAHAHTHLSMACFLWFHYLTILGE